MSLVGSEDESRKAQAPVGYGWVAAASYAWAQIQSACAELNLGPLYHGLRLLWKGETASPCLPLIFGEPSEKRVWQYVAGKLLAQVQCASGYLQGAAHKTSVWLGGGM